MPTPRLSLGYSPRYWRFSRLCERPQSLSYRTLLHRHRARLRTLPFQLVPSRSQTTIPQRHGTAVEHIPQPPPGRTPPPKPSQNAAKQPKEEDDGASEARTKEPPKPAIGGSSNSNVSAIEVAGNDAKTKPESVGRKPDDPSAPSADPSDPSTVASPAPSSDEATDSAPRPFSDSMALQTVASSRPLETVLHMEPPTTSQDEARYRTPPHLEPAPYVHHFDTYTLVKDLSKGGFTDDQSVTIMKAVRSLLAVNLDIAKEGLVSKSDVENESYLFRAACSELRTEVTSGRQAATEKMRSERAHLQHEVDILGQRVTQETLALKDQLKGMFDDRRMAVRTEQRGMDSAITELNYKITVAMAGDAKGDVEGLRWFLTRRAAMVIGGMAFLILGSLRYSHYMSQTQEQERAKMARQRQAEASFIPTSPSVSAGASPGSTRNAGDGDGNGETEAILAARLKSGGG